MHPRPERSNPLVEAVAYRDSDILGTVETAIRSKSVLLAYQPVVAAHAPHPVTFHEALIRICDPSGRVIPAHAFIHQVADSELGRLIDCLSLEQGLAALGRNPGLRLAINMSARSIGYRRWRQILDRRLRGDPTIAERLILELNEESVIRLPELAQAFIADLRARGISFALDDFGAGRSDFRALRTLDFDILKIDGQFVRNVAQDADNQVVTRAMRAIATEFDMLITASRVEHAADAAYLAEIGIDCLQGYHFAAPTTQPDFALEFLTRDDTSAA